MNDDINNQAVKDFRVKCCGVLLAFGAHTITYR